MDARTKNGDNLIKNELLGRKRFCKRTTLIRDRGERTKEIQSCRKEVEAPGAKG